MKQQLKKILLFNLLSVLSFPLCAQNLQGFQKLRGEILSTQADDDYSHHKYNAFDTNEATSFMARDVGGWIGLDFGKQYSIRKIRVYPMPDRNEQFVGSRFQAASNPEFKDPVTLFTVTNVPKAGEYITYDIANQNEFRYVRCINSNHRCSVAELEFYTEENKQTVEYKQLTNLPTIYIETQGRFDFVTKENYASSKVIISDGSSLTEFPADVRGRGNSTWFYMEKKPFRIKFNSKQNFLGLSASNKNWTLIACAVDKTLIRNGLAFEMSRFFGFEFTPACVYVDVVLDGFYYGTYMASDHINVDKNRVNVTEMTSNDTSPATISGGYHLEIDAYAEEEPVYFKTNRGVPFTVKSPDEEVIVKAQYEWIKNHINKLEEELFNNPENACEKYIDIESAVKYYLHSELTGNCDSYWCLHCYKKRGDDKLYFGPVWDYDQAFLTNERVPLNIATLDTYHGSAQPWFRQIMQTKAAQKVLAELWKKSKNENLLQKLLDYVDHSAKRLQQSQALNYQRWNSLNRKVWFEDALFNTYDKYIDFVKQYMVNRFAWFDDYYPGEKKDIFLPSVPGNPLQTWKYTFSTPADGWYKASFDDSKWQSGKAPFGTERNLQNTLWTTNQIFIRTTFNVSNEILENIDKTYFYLFHDEDCWIYLNDKLAFYVSGYNTNYQTFTFDKSFLKEGINNIAVKCTQTAGGQLIDVGIFGSAREPEQTWTNPLTLKNEWPLYGIGDPYILKYRGVYYLYCSTKDNNTGIKCWSTKDFITWSDAYTCSTEAITKTAYAPEVVYWNGKFYMYTSPGGNGHYVLTSDSPTGPFTVATGNIGKSIDGSIFIEDDGKWYFYHAGDNGIMGCAMNNPTYIGQSVNMNAKTGYGWTEGATVIKRNGVYYMIYTGNHVISKGYRIDYATNTTGPISSYTPQSSQNPILISSEGSHVGLGHGSAFIGPDLDSYYYTYHNLAGDFGVGPYRRLNFDRIAWNGTKLLLLGATTWPQEAFHQADMSDYFNRMELGAKWSTPDGGNWTIKNRDMLVQELTNNEEDFYKALYEQPTKADYTAEFTMIEEQSDSNDSHFGAVFGYTNEANYGIAVLNSSTNRLEINFKMNNEWGTPAYSTLPTGFRFDVWHHLRIEKLGTNYKFFIDGMQKGVITSSLGAGKVGYATNKCQAGFGYIAFSNKVNGSGILDVYKPIPGIISAVHYITKSEGEISQVSCSEGGYAINGRSAEWYDYKVNVKATGHYNLGLRYLSSEATELRIWQGDTDLTGIIKLPPSTNRSIYNTFTIKNLNLSEGYQTLRIETVNGNFNFYEMRFEEGENSIVTLTDSFDTNFSQEWNYKDGNWIIRSEEAEINGYGKMTMGNTGWTNYTVQVDVTYINTFNGGLIFRVQNPALGGAGDNSALGTDYLQAYFVSLSSNGVTLGKHNYNWTELASKTGESYVTNKKYTLRVDVKGANIKIYVDNMETPKIDYTDTNQFICGKVGLRVCNAHIRFDNFIVTTSDDGINTNIEKLSIFPDLKLYPNPVTNELKLENLSDFSDLSIYNAVGQEIFREKIYDSSRIISTSGFVKGLYIIRLTGISRKNVIEKFIKI